MVNLGHENESKTYILRPSDIDSGCESIVSILNKCGRGDLYIGVEQDGRIVGISSFNQNIAKTIFNKINNSIEPSIYPSINYDENLNIIKISFAGNEIPYTYKKEYFIRSYDVNRKLDYFSIMNEIRFLNQNKFFESNKTKESFRNINDNIIKDIYVRAGAKKNKHPSVKETLKKLSLITDGSINQAGYYLFSKRSPLDITINVYADEQKKKILKTSLIKGNIFELIEKSLKIIQDEQQKNKASKVIDSQLLEETLLFSFMNTSFLKKEEFAIQITPYEINYRFPGTLYSLETLEEYYQYNYKIPTKNKLISNAFQFAGKSNSIEECLSKIQKYCSDNSIIFSGISNKNIVSISYYRYSQKQKSMTIEQTILSILTTRPTIRAELLAKKLGKTRRTIQTIMKKLKESNLIIRKGSNKNGYWIVNK